MGIDSGNIIFTKRPKIEESDNYGTINSKSIILGIESILKAIELIKNNRLNSIEQWEDGKLFFDRDWNSYLAYRYFKTRDRFLSTYCRLQRENRLPKVKLVENGVIL